MNLCCPLCLDKNDDPFHLFCECTDTLIQGERDRLRASLVDMLVRLAGKINEMIRLSTKNGKLIIELEKRLTLLQEKLAEYKDSPGTNTADINFVTYHMLTAVPFSADLPEYLEQQHALSWDGGYEADAPSQDGSDALPATSSGDMLPTMPLALALGRVFDATVLQNRYMRSGPPARSRLLPGCEGLDCET
jgi:hypothetical protein